MRDHPQQQQQPVSQVREALTLWDISHLSLSSLWLHSRCWRIFLPRWRLLLFLWHAAFAPPAAVNNVCHTIGMPGGRRRKPPAGRRKSWDSSGFINHTRRDVYVYVTTCRSLWLWLSSLLWDVAQSAQGCVPSCSMEKIVLSHEHALQLLKFSVQFYDFTIFQN